jgi:hypothetical protein
MKTTLSSRSFFILATVTLLFSIQASAQTWTFRNGFGQNDAGTGFPDIGRAVCTDAAGNIYVTGKISDATVGNTVNFGGTALVSAGDDDGFVAKFNSSGVHQWSLRFGGTLLDEGGFGIATDGTSVYVTGETNGTMTVGTSATTYPVVGGGIDGLVMKLDAASGTLSWVRRFGGTNSDRGQAICLDVSGNVYVSGVFRTRNNAGNTTATFGTFTRTVQGNVVGTYTSDLFVEQLNPSTGAINWVSTGGIAGGNDNINGSGICYVPSLSEVIVTGSFRWAATGTTTATYSTTTPASTVTLTNSSATVNEDFCLLEVASATGAFVSGSGVGAGGGNEAGLGITYDSFTGDVFFAGYFSSASTTFPGNAANINASAGRDNIIYGRYNPSTDAYIWVKDVDNSLAAAAVDDARAIVSDGLGGLYMTGNFRNTANFPGGSTVTASGVQSDIFLARINVANGNAIVLTQGTGTSTTADDIGNGVAYSLIGNNTWITGQYASNITFSPLAVLASQGNTEDIILAKFNNPAPVVTSPPSASTQCTGLAASFSVTATGTGLTYQWQESANAGFTSPVTLTNTGIYSTVTTTTLNISDNTTVNGKYYRVAVTNVGGTIYSSGALLTATTPILPTGNITATHAVNTSNNLYYGASCAIISKVVPSGATPISGSVTSDTWVEGSVLTYGGIPYVQRHYQITPSAGTTATVTLYFSQADFDNFNAAPGSTLDLPVDATDVANNKANLRISKLNGASNNGTGLPGSYTSGGSLIDPVDANIIWSSAFNRWEVTFPVTGFSGFFVQTSTLILPVNLLSFAAQRNNNDIRLKWQTASETNNNYFELQRSIDGRTFTPVTQVPGINGNDVKNYEWNDAGAALLNASKVFYRLKIVSQSGSAEFSNTIIVYLNKGAVLITNVTPNPFTDKFDLGLNMPVAGPFTLKIMDMNGAVLLKKIMYAAKGFSTQPITGLEKISAGIYFLSVDVEGTEAVYKIVK